jgi:tRNA G10  N-methylase Trm11
LTIRGIDNRIVELRKFIKEYKKNSHRDAFESAERLKQKSGFLNIKIEEFQFNILSNVDLPKQVTKIDIVIADVPYGKLSNWTGLKGGINPIQASLDKIKNRLNNISIVAIVLNKKQEILYKGYTKIKSFKLTKRKIVLLKPNF